MFVIGTIMLFIGVIYLWIGLFTVFDHYASPSHRVLNFIITIIYLMVGYAFISLSAQGQAPCENTITQCTHIEASCEQIDSH